MGELLDARTAMAQGENAARPAESVGDLIKKEHRNGECYGYACAMSAPEDLIKDCTMSIEAIRQQEDEGEEDDD